MQTASKCFAAGEQALWGVHEREGNEGGLTERVASVLDPRDL